MGFTVNDNVGKTHRTALLIDAADSTSTYQERARRLLESLNGSNIKVDVFTTATGGGTNINRLEDPKQLDVSNADDFFNPSEFHEWASARGYDQILVSLPRA